MNKKVIKPTTRSKNTPKKTKATSTTDRIKRLAQPKYNTLSGGTAVSERVRQRNKRRTRAVFEAVRSGATAVAKAGRKGRRVRMPVLPSSLAASKKRKPASPATVKRMRTRRKKERIL